MTLLCPNPTYPIHAFGFLMAGGVIRSMSVEPDELLPAAGTRRRAIRSRSRSALILNYPSNPTAYVATLDFYKDVIAFAKKHDIIVLSDLAYSEIYFDDDAAAVGSRSSGRDGCDGRVHLDVEVLLRCRAGAWALLSATSV